MQQVRATSTVAIAATAAANEEEEEEHQVIKVRQSLVLRKTQIP
jgi:hypothetical protein